MGLLWAEESADLLDGYSWHKNPEPVFVSSEKNKQFDQDITLYSLRRWQRRCLSLPCTTRKNEGIDPLNNPNRHANAQVFSWDIERIPQFW